MKVIPLFRFIAKAAPYRLQGIISTVLIWESRRKGAKGIFSHYVAANPALSQVDWVNNVPFGQGDSLLDGLTDHTVELTYREAYHLFEETMRELNRANIDIEQEILEHWASLEEPEPMSEDEWIELLLRLFDRPLGPKEVVHAYFQAWAVDDWALIYMLLPKKVRSRYNGHLDYAARMLKKHRGESLLRGIVVEESPSKKGVSLLAEVLVGKEQFLLTYRSHFHLVEEEGRWIITSIRKEPPSRITAGQEPFFQGFWFWRVFPTKNADRILEMLQQMDGSHVEEGERGTAVVYLSRLNDSLDMGLDVARDARGQVWIGRREIAIGAVTEEHLTTLVQEMRREKIIGHTQGRGPYRLPEMANYAFREGTYTTFEDLLESWEVKPDDDLIWPDGWSEAAETDPVARAVAETAQIGSLLTQFVQWRFAAQWKKEWTSFVRQTDEPSTPFEENPQGALFWEWFIFDRPLRGGTTTLEVFLREVGGHLSPPLRRAVETWLTNRPGFYLTVSLEDEGYWVRDLFSDDQYFVRDPDYKREKPPYEVGYLLFCRLIPWEGVYRYGGIAHFFPPWYRSTIIGFVRGLWASGHIKKPFIWHEVWKKKSRQILSFIIELRSKPIAPKLMTAEGHRAGMSRALYRVNDFPAVKKSIEQLPELVFSGRKRRKAQGEFFSYDWVERGLTAQIIKSIQSNLPNEEHEGVQLTDIFHQCPDGRSLRQLGTLTLHKQYAVIDTISKERLDVLKRVLVKYCGFYLSHDEDVFEEAEALPSTVVEDKT